MRNYENGLLWTGTAGGNISETANAIFRTTGGSFAVAGTTQTFGAGSTDAYIVILDASGNVCAQYNPASGGTVNTGGGTTLGGGSSSTGGTAGSGGI